MKNPIIFFSIFSSLCLALQVEVFFLPQNKSEIINIISSAQREVLVCSMSVDDPDVLNVLKRLESAGVDIRIVSEYPVGGFKNRVDSDPRSILHSKFVVVDGEYVVLGSANLTESGLEKDLNDVIVFEDEDVAGFFEGLFNSIWYGIPNPGYLESDLGNFYASPFVDLEKVIAGYLIDAKRSVDVSIFAFTDMNVLGLLKFLTYKGVKVRIIADDWCEKNRSFLDLPTDQFELKVFENLHHKFLIVDGRVLITGSANITESGFHRNFEVVFITDKKDIVGKYIEHFENLWNQPLTAP